MLYSQVKTYENKSLRDSELLQKEQKGKDAKKSHKKTTEITLYDVLDNCKINDKIDQILSIRTRGRNVITEDKRLENTEMIQANKTSHVDEMINGMINEKFNIISDGRTQSVHEPFHDKQKANKCRIFTNFIFN